MSAAAAPPAKHAVPADARERLTQNLARLLAGIRRGLADPKVNARQAGRWTRVSAALEQDLARLSGTQDRAVDAEPELVACASELRFLARTTDGYPLDFAGPELAGELERDRRLTVLAAWQIVAAAEGSGASGL